MSLELGPIPAYSLSMIKISLVLSFICFSGIVFAKETSGCADFSGWYVVEKANRCQSVLGGNFAWFKQENCNQIQYTFVSTHWSGLNDFSASEIPIMIFSAPPLVRTESDGKEVETTTTQVERLAHNTFKVTHSLVSSIYPLGMAMEMAFRKESDQSITVLRKTSAFRVECRLTPEGK